jgi:hypothetical protein
MPPVVAALPSMAAVGSTLGSIGAALGPIGTISSAVGGIQSLIGGNKQKSAAPAQPAQAPAFNPSKPSAIAAPSSLSDMSGYDPTQQRTALATKGVQSGLGADEDAYYRNLIQRSLIGDNNQVTGDTSSLSPVESQYFSKQGMNTSDIMKFLQQLQG